MPIASATTVERAPTPEADPQAVENAGEHVAALVVGAEPEGHAGHALPAGRELRIHDVELREIVRDSAARRAGANIAASRISDERRQRRHRDAVARECPR